MASRPISSRPYGTGRPFRTNPGLASWAKFSRPSGTEFGNSYSMLLMVVRWGSPVSSEAELGGALHQASLKAFAAVAALPALPGGIVFVIAWANTTEQYCGI